ncbi:nitrogenase iron-molybdenum cofactor biosynthesis protein NifN [Consotaella salsifontis]|uniref:Nitrogenase iron-molybdenum cofactor biosynthesis protein NifN n=1 Tax=Consotaella salsifontis TaxID=1365950 RepID=A0A1T4S8J1_9HYPH|nr:nitrogenase iron-molybdenum cofactor biosynthesis protein NifN [Consotaella salsifontis]SKA24620.1 nitrogenase molybdenum-iron protein NifN [Consotaella salsifontis]
MARIFHPRSALSTNPLKQSAPLGAALAYLGIEGSIPLFHGSQGCTAFALVSLVRHFKEAIPLQTTAMNEVSTILGGAEQIEEAIENLRKKSAPKFIGIASTALTETRGEDVAGELRAMRARRRDFDDTAIVYAATPDFSGGLEEGWARAVAAIIDALVPDRGMEHVGSRSHQVTLLAGSHLTPADVEEIVSLIRAFGLEPVVLPDISTSLDGHLGDTWSGTSLGGTRLADISRLGRSRHTLVIGESLRPAAEMLERRTAVPSSVFPSLTGLKCTDAFIETLMAIAAVRDVPERVKRDRSRLVDASLDAHFSIGGLRVAIGADPDLLFSLSGALTSLGADIVAAVATAATNPVLDRVPAEEVAVADLGELEARAAAAEAEILITHSHGRQAAARLGLPLVRAGFPIFDRLGTQDVCRVGYRGTRAFFTEIANAVLARDHRPHPSDFGAAPIEQEFEHARSQTASH